ncbi:bleomycin resistance protein [Aestuariispira insulae]|uniref:Bleomycin resistance protein n=1 Tax=Aestuariispira insulae TaxID=1461337 RepID=A0A3D9HSM1_9PROT|nr:VOC family protein [Aestuariispira insulae]RED52415.1 catechol 2,3-dioxygenase-like lactoylglutathione lyase family enzyme [Aestuariispira insulae]
MQEPRAWARLVPELMVSDFDASLGFYQTILGFSFLYGRENFAYLDREGAQIMIELQSDDPAWKTGTLSKPYGRGANFQIEVVDVASLYRTVIEADCEVRLPLEEAWYRMDDGTETGNRQFMIQDPDGYLLRFFQDLGTRPAVS